MNTRNIGIAAGKGLMFAATNRTPIMTGVVLTVLAATLFAGVVRADGGGDWQPQTIPGQWGYIDRTGTWVIAPRFDEGLDFHHGRARVKLDGRYGYIDTHGKLVVGAQYDEIASFSEGLLRVRIGGRVGFLNADHRVAIEPRFDDAADFANGLARVKLSGKWGFADANGKLVIPPQFDSAHDFSENRARVVLDGKAGYIDRAGKLIVAPKYAVNSDGYGAEDFHDGLALVAQGDVWQRTFAYLDHSGKIAIPFAAGDAYSFSEGLAVVKRPAWSFNPQVWLRGGGTQWLYGYMDTAGAMVIRPRFAARPNRFSDGLALVGSDRHFEYIDRSGRTVLGPYAEGSDFRFGHALVQGPGALHTYIDKQGKVVSQPWALYNYEAGAGDHPTRDSPDGLERIEIETANGKRIGYRDVTGALQIGPRYMRARPFSEGWAAALDEAGNTVCIDRRGDVAHGEDPSILAGVGELRRERVRGPNTETFYELFDPSGARLAGPYHFIGTAAEGLIRVQPRATSMVYADAAGSRRLAGPFDTALPFEDGVGRVQIDGKWGAIDAEGNTIVAARFDEIRAFREGHAAVAIGAAPARLWGFVNRRDEVVVPVRFDEVGEFSEGLAVARLHAQGSGYVDNRGQWVVQPQFYDAGRFREGRAAVRVLDGPDAVGKMGYIDRSGKLVSQPVWDGARELSEGRAAVKKLYEWGYVDAAGAVIVAPRFTEAGEFSNGVARVHWQGRDLLIDRDGNIVADPAPGK